MMLFDAARILSRYVDNEVRIAVEPCGATFFP